MSRPFFLPYFLFLCIFVISLALYILFTHEILAGAYADQRSRRLTIQQLS